MTEPNSAELSSSGSTFPPRKGLSFFLLWSTGVCCTALLGRIQIEGDLPDRFFFMTSQLLVAAWWSYLVFPNWARRVGWLVLPLISEIPAFRYGAMDDLWNGALTQHFYWAGLCLPGIIQFALLTGVRQRPWIWLPLSAFYVWVLTNGRFFLMEPMFKLAHRMQDLGFGPFQLRFSNLEDGVILMPNVLMGAALAWWMQPKQDGVLPNVRKSPLPAILQA
jgi:hypothetical protein